MPGLLRSGKFRDEPVRETPVVDVNAHRCEPHWRVLNALEGAIDAGLEWRLGPARS